MKYYKVTGKNGEPCNGGSGKYHLPTKRKDGTWKPGKWMPAIKGELMPCEVGYHLCRQQDLIQWLGQEIYEAEYKGERIDKDDKIVVRQVRLIRKIEAWTDRSAREFACWCVRNTPLENGKTTWSLLTDQRSKDAVIVAEKYAKGEATKEELDAARDAAWAAARAAAGAAAWAAARAAAGAAAWDAAGAAAWAATRAAAWAAAGAAAWDAARDAAWAAQTRHLFEILGE